MSILSGFKKIKKYIKTSSGYMLRSLWTSANTVEMDDGTTVQNAIAELNSGKAASNHTHNYAGSSSAGGAANSVKTNLTLKLNGGSTEGTNLFTFNGSAAKTVNITPASIGAAASSHTHNYAAASHGNHVPATQTANNAKFLRNDNTWQTVTPANIGAAASSHSHSNYVSSFSIVEKAGSSTTINAGTTVDFTITFSNPSGGMGSILTAWCSNSGWAGVICQGVYRISGLTATFTLYNASSVARTVTPKFLATILIK